MSVFIGFLNLVHVIEQLFLVSIITFTCWSIVEVINSSCILPYINLVVDILSVLDFPEADLRVYATYFSRGLVKTFFLDWCLAWWTPPWQLLSDRLLSFSPPPGR